MEPALITAAVAAVGGLGLTIGGVLSRARARDEDLADVLRLPYGEGDVDISRVAAEHGAVVAGTLGLAGSAIERFSGGEALRHRIERADLSIRPAELVVISTACGLAAGLFTAMLTGLWWAVIVVLGLTPAITIGALNYLAGRRVKAFSRQLPEALSLVSSSLSAGHTFLRSIQMMADEFDRPLADEFRRVLAETQLGAPLITSLERMGTRLELSDVDWLVQAIRIQQTVGGQLAELLATLADFMRAREEVRREINVLTAEGRISAWVLGAMPIFLFFAILVVNPGYMDPMLQGWGLLWLGLTGLAMAIGIAMILKMVKAVDV